MKSGLSQKMVMREQLTGLSPTVCRRIIKTLRAEAEKGGGGISIVVHNMLVDLLITQVGYPTPISYGTENYPKRLEDLLKGAEEFLNIVEGKTE